MPAGLDEQEEAGTALPSPTLVCRDAGGSSFALKVLELLHSYWHLHLGTDSEFLFP